jgi:hypothetical protein
LRWVMIEEGGGGVQLVGQKEGLEDRLAEYRLGPPTRPGVSLLSDAIAPPPPGGVAGPADAPPPTVSLQDLSAGRTVAEVSRPSRPLRRSILSRAVPQPLFQAAGG